MSSFLANFAATVTNTLIDTGDIRDLVVEDLMWNI